MYAHDLIYLITCKFCKTKYFFYHFDEKRDQNSDRLYTVKRKLEIN